MSPPDPAYLRVRDVAARLAIDDEGVLALIRTGVLPATDVRRPGARRPRWRIDPQDLELFLAARRLMPKPAATRRRKPKAGFVTEYF